MSVPVYQNSRHASVRQQQRGIRRDVLELAIAFADDEQRARGGCCSLGLSRREANHLAFDGAVDSTLLRQATKLRVVLARDGTVVTVFRGERRRIGRNGRLHRRKPTTRGRWGR